MTRHGVNPGPLVNWDLQLPYLANVFGNTVFAFIFHHSTAGIVVPVRPQTSVRRMVVYSHIVGSLFLGIEGFLAWLAFGEFNKYKGDDS